MFKAIIMSITKAATYVQMGETFFTNYETYLTVTDLSQVKQQHFSNKTNNL